MKPIRQPALVTALAAACLLLPARPAAANRQLPVTLDQLAEQAALIVIGRVEALASGVDPSVDGIYTYVTIRPTDILKGAAPAGPLVVKQLGGVVAERGVHVPGQAVFTDGEEVVLFLAVRPRDRTLFTLGLWQGKWTIRTDPSSGERHALQQEPTTGTVVDERTLVRLRATVALRAPADRRDGADIQTAPDDGPRQRVSSPFVLNNPPIRWTQFPVRVNIETGTQPGLAGGGLAEIAGAIGLWNAPGSGLSLVLGGRLPARCQAVAGTEILVTFNDPCGEISSDPNVLAVAAFGFSTSGGQTVNGRFFLPITDAVITTSSHPDARPFLTTSPCFQSTIAHEIGHSVGFDHTPDTTALMFFIVSNACNQGPLPLGADDLAGLFAIYPAAGTPPPGGGTPGMPVVTSAAATGGVLNLAWTPGAGAAPTAHRLDFFAGVTPVASVTVGAASSAALPIPPGTVGSFTVRVTPLTGATAGPPSALFPFTIGGGGGGCTGPPAAPAVSGSIVAGTATVTWAAVPGATSYIVSAGSAQGGSNVSPPANVGAATTVGASGLPPGFSTWVRVVAMNACGQSGPTDFFLS